MFICTLELRHYIQIQTNQEAEYFIIGQHFLDPGLIIGEEITVHYPEINQELYEVGNPLALKAKVIETETHIYVNKNKRIASIVSNLLKISEETCYKEGVIHLRIYLECEDRDLMVKFSNYIKKYNNIGV
jgi:hypothetical protein